MSQDMLEVYSVTSRTANVTQLCRGACSCRSIVSTSSPSGSWFRSNSITWKNLQQTTHKITQS